LTYNYLKAAEKAASPAVVNVSLDVDTRLSASTQIAGGTLTGIEMQYLKGGDPKK
jgi:hypothetical protein